MSLNSILHLIFWIIYKCKNYSELTSYKKIVSSWISLMCPDEGARGADQGFHVQPWALYEETLLWVTEERFNWASVSLSVKWGDIRAPTSWGCLDLIRTRMSSLPWVVLEVPLDTVPASSSSKPSRTPYAFTLSLFAALNLPFIQLQRNGSCLCVLSPHVSYRPINLPYDTPSAFPWLPQSLWCSPALGLGCHFLFINRLKCCHALLSRFFHEELQGKTEDELSS